MPSFHTTSHQEKSMSQWSQQIKVTIDELDKVLEVVIQITDTTSFKYTGTFLCKHNLVLLASSLCQLSSALLTSHSLWIG